MKKNILLLILISITIQIYGQQTSDGINAARFGLLEQKDATPAILKALDACYESGASRLNIPKGTYHFYPDYALEEYLAITGASNGLRRIAFPLFNFENLIIDGFGSTFIFHGMMLPFEVQECKNISIRNINIRFAQTVWGEGTVSEADKAGSSFTLTTNPADSLGVIGGVLSVKNEGENLPVKMVGWLKSNEKTSCSFLPSSLSANRHISAKPLSRPHFWIEAPVKSLPRIGWKLIWEQNNEKIKDKISPVFHLSGSDGVTFSNLSVRNVPGRVIVSEQSGNVMLDRINVLPDSLMGRKLSLSTGGVRFIGCQKRLVITNCRFSGIMGDAVSVSGPTLKVIKRISNSTLGVRQINEKQWGSPFAQVGDTLRLINAEHTNLRCERVVTRIRDLNEQYQELWFDRPLPESVQQGTLLANISRQPEVVLRSNVLNNVIGNGIKLQTSGKITVEGNQIRSGKHGINLGGEFDMAFEPVMLNQVFIKNNTFRRCGDGKANNALILIGPVMSAELADTSYLHKDITIEGNTFYNAGQSIVEAMATSGLIVRQNTIFAADSEKPVINPLIRLSRCKKVGIVGNRYMDKQEAFVKIDEVKDLLFFNNEGIVSP